MSTTLVAQVLPKSCWAAALEMFTAGQLNQCELLKVDFNPSDPSSAPDFCDLDNAGTYEGNLKILTEMGCKLSGAANNAIPFSRLDTIPVFSDLQRNVGSSAIVLHSWDFDSSQHYVVPSGTYEQVLTASIKLNWIKVLDPFPEFQGRTYYLNYVEFKSDSWFVGIIYHKHTAVNRTPAPRTFSDVDAKNLIKRYIRQLPANVPAPFRTDTHASRLHTIEDYEFTVTNSSVELLLDDADSFVDDILTFARDMKMYLAGSNNRYTSFFLNANDNGRYYMAMIEDGTRYVPVVSSAVADVANLPAESTSAQPRSVNASESKVIEKLDEIEKALFRYFEKRLKSALICRFFDIGQEYVFFMKEGKVQVFDPFKSFSYMLPKDHKKPSYLPLDEFFKTLTQFYTFLKDKKYGK